MASYHLPIKIREMPGYNIHCWCHGRRYLHSAAAALTGRRDWGSSRRTWRAWHDMSFY